MGFKVAAESVLREKSDNTKLYYTLVAGEVDDSFEFVRAAKDKDSELPVLPKDKIKIVDFVDDSDDKGIIPSKGKTAGTKESVTDVFSFLNKLNPDLQWEPGTEARVEFSSLHEPGTLQKVVATKISDKLRALCKQITESDDSKTMTNFILACLQLMLTVTTSKESKDDDSFSIVIPVGSNPILKYSEVRDAVHEGAKGYGIENPLRQYFRLFSATTSNLIANGKLKVNSKVAMQHGVTKEFLPYTFDFFRPDYRFCNDNQILAWQQASEVAFSRKKTSNEQVVHNTIELGRRQR